MNIFDYLAIILISILGAAMLGFLIQPLGKELSALCVKGKGLGNLWRIKKRVSTTTRVDSFISNKNFHQALKEIRSNLVFRDIRSLKEIAIMKEHHQNMLSRIVIIAEELDTHPASIGRLEHLFITWAELNQRRIKTKESFTNISSRRSSSGKTIPLWSKASFSLANKEIESALKENRQELEQEISKLINELLSKKPTYYH